MIRLLLVSLCCVAIVSCGRGREEAAPAAAAHALVPLPETVEWPAGDGFLLTGATTISVPSGNERAAWIGRYLSELVGLAAGDAPPAVNAGSAASTGVIQLRLASPAVPGSEAYELTVSSERIVVAAGDPAGLFYGVQTLRQLMPGWIDHEAVRADENRPIRIPAARIVDRPRFASRGAMLDVARHFFSVDEVERYIDLAALYKFNRLHLHLSDDQGWRIEIKSWPNLAMKGGMTEVGGGPGGYYTQAQYAELAAYAADRFVTIVPEIDMPGHTNAALASYGELNCDGVARPPYTGVEVGFSAFCVEKDLTYKFIDDVVREIAAVTPGPCFHIGGDEVKTLTPPQYIAFIERVQKIVQAHGKQMIGWDEIAPAALLPTTLVQHWRPDGASTTAVEKGAKVIISVASRAYLDMKYDEATAIGQDWAARIAVRDAYDWDPATVAAGVPAAAIIGVEAPIWTETLATIADVEFMAFPRLAAIAEVAWTPQASRRWDDFARRLGAQAPRWAALGVNFYRAPEIPWSR